MKPHARTHTCTHTHAHTHMHTHTCTRERCSEQRRAACAPGNKTYSAEAPTMNNPAPSKAILQFASSFHLFVDSSVPPRAMFTPLWAPFEGGGFFGATCVLNRHRSNGRVSTLHCGWRVAVRSSTCDDWRADVARAGPIIRRRTNDVILLWCRGGVGGGRGGGMQGRLVNNLLGFCSRDKHARSSDSSCRGFSNDGN